MQIKRKLSELIAIYIFEREFNDIYLEGPVDKFTIEGYLAYKKTVKICYEVDSIDFTEIDGKYKDLDLHSNKDKLIALSRELSLAKISSNVICIVDRDFDGVLYSLEKNSHLVHTDYCCLESYFLSEVFINKIIKIGIRNFPITPHVIICEISRIISTLFIVRMIKKHFDLYFPLPDIANYFKVDRETGKTDFDSNLFLDKILIVNKLAPRKKEIMEFVDSIVAKLNIDIRFQMNGHDYINILFNYINKVKNTPNFKIGNFENALHLAIQPDFLDDYDLFNRISK